MAIEEAKVSEVPIKSSFDVTLTEVIEDDHIHQVLEGQGIATHLGKIDFKMEEVVDFTTMPWTAVAEAVQIAGYGDELHVSWESTVKPINYPILTIEGAGLIDGGTGRFTN